MKTIKEPQWNDRSRKKTLLHTKIFANIPRIITRFILYIIFLNRRVDFIYFNVMSFVKIY